MIIAFKKIVLLQKNKKLKKIKDYYYHWIILDKNDHYKTIISMKMKMNLHQKFLNHKINLIYQI